MALVTATAGMAQDFKPQMQKYMTDQAADRASDPIIVDAIITQNARTGSYDQGKIVELDALWMAQPGVAGVPPDRWCPEQPGFRLSA